MRRLLCVVFSDLFSKPALILIDGLLAEPGVLRKFFVDRLQNALQFRLGSIVKINDLSAIIFLEGFQRSFVPRQVLSGTGAGDTTIAAFLTAVLDGYAPDKAFKLAAATGASCVEGYDALSGLKSFEELEKKIKAGWKENGT